MTVPPSAMVAAIMPILGTRAMMAVMMTMIATTLDNDSLRVRDRRRSDNDRTKRSQDNSKLLHSSPSSSIEPHIQLRVAAIVPAELDEISERPLRHPWLRRERSSQDG
jgi:hypothetical protein